MIEQIFFIGGSPNDVTYNSFFLLYRVVKTRLLSKVALCVKQRACDRKLRTVPCSSGIPQEMAVTCSLGNQPTSST